MVACVRWYVCGGVVGGGMGGGGCGGMGVVVWCGVMVAKCSCPPPLDLPKKTQINFNQCGKKCEKQ